MSITFSAITHDGRHVDSLLSAFTFPDGATHIKGATNQDEYKYHVADLRGLDHTDLFHLAMWQLMVDEIDGKSVVLLPYLPGARADRGTPSCYPYVKFITDVVVPNQIITLDPHSPAWIETLDHIARGVVKSSVFPVERIIARELGGRGHGDLHPYVGVIAPDKGAVDRAQRAADVLHVPLFKAEKSRDFETGKLTGFTCEELPEQGKLLLVDDICDGGGTFIGLAKATGLPRERIDLWVTHGVFSKGFSDLTEYIGHIHTTDSYDPLLPLFIPPRVTVHPVLPYLLGEIK